jgi:hypothetical protein
MTTDLPTENEESPVQPVGVDAEVVEHMEDGLSKPLPKYEPPPPWWFISILCIFPALLGFVGGLFVVEMGWLQPDRYQTEVEHLKFEADLAKTNATFYHSMYESYVNIHETDKKTIGLSMSGLTLCKDKLVACENRRSRW